MTLCVICHRETCEDEAMCALFWNLDNFNDYEPEDKEDPYERYEEEFDS